MNKTRTYFLILIFSILYSQNVDMYLSLLEKGNIKDVRETLPELISKFPNDVGISN